MNAKETYSSIIEELIEDYRSGQISRSQWEKAIIEVADEWSEHLGE